MIIEVTGVNTWNKGAELMLVAIKDRFARLYPDVKLVVDTWFGTYQERAQYGLWLKPDIRRVGRSKIALSLMPPSFKQDLGIVGPKDIDAVLDASGFAFGDQHPAERAINFAEQVEDWHREQKPVVLLPQALGPFERTQIRDAFIRIADASNLIFARDDASLQHVRSAAGSASHVHLAPDFTNLVKPHSDKGTRETETVYIVPNQRMIEKATSQEQSNAYIPFLASCITAVEESDLRPVILIHGRHDGSLVNGIFKEIGHEVEVIKEENPVEIKRLLGEGYLVIASRFHALVSALSQGVPCIATSWSHKYEMLFRDYNCEDMILPVEASQDTIRQRVESAIGTTRSELVHRIKTQADHLIQQAQSMWKQVDQELGLIQAG